MRQSTCLTMTLVFTIIAVTALICAVICDAADNSSRSVTFGCIACACSIPAFSSASLLLQSGINSMKANKKSETDEDISENAEPTALEEDNDAE